MCNCGCDPADLDEAKDLRRKTVVMASSAAGLSALPLIFAIPGPAHHLLIVGVITVQAMLLGRALLLIRQRKQLLAGD
jgi:hypothetical protein